MTITLIIITIISLTYLTLIIRELKNIKNQLHSIREDDKTNRQLSVDFHQKTIDDLVSEINNLIKDRQGEREELEYEKEKIKNQITSISHDLRTPLTAIVGYVEILKNEDENREKYLEIIENKSKTLQKLVKDFYEISLLEDKNYELEIQSLYPSYILEETLMDYIDELETRNIKTEIKIEDDYENPIDPDALGRAYANIISNIKHHGEKEASIYHGLKNGKLTTIIKNIPVEKEHLEPEKIFDKFYIGEKTRHNTSTGIGMYGTKLLLEKMNIKIAAYLDDGELVIQLIYPKAH